MGWIEINCALIKCCIITKMLSASQWTATKNTRNCGGPRGETGDRGPTGASGISSPGSDGPVGDTGPIGSTGPVGSTGAIGTQGAEGVPDVVYWNIVSRRVGTYPDSVVIYPIDKYKLFIFDNTTLGNLPVKLFICTRDNIRVWNDSIVYNKGDIVSFFDSTVFICIADRVVGTNPAVGFEYWIPRDWNNNFRYSKGMQITHNSIWYESLIDNNYRNIPDVSPTTWKLVPPLEDFYVLIKNGSATTDSIPNRQVQFVSAYPDITLNDAKGGTIVANYKGADNAIRGISNIRILKYSAANPTQMYLY